MATNIWDELQQFDPFRLQVKLIKLHEGCQGKRLATQMDEMCELLPKMIALRQSPGGSFWK